MPIVDRRKDRTYVLGVPVATCRVKGDRLVRKVFGITVSRRKSEYAMLVTAAEGDAYDSRPVDAEIASLVEDVKIDPALCGLSPADGVAFLSTKLRDKSGGDMRWMEDAMDLLGGRHSVRLFLTDLAKSAHAGRRRLAAYRTRYGVFGVSQHPDMFKHRVKELAEAILRFNPKALFVFIRPSDIWGAAVLALLKRSSKIRIVYCPHADAHLNVGVAFGDIFPLPLKRRLTLHRDRQRMVPYVVSRSALTSGVHKVAGRMPEAERAAVRRELGIPDGAVFTLSGGEASKFFNADGSSDYFRTVKALLVRNPEVRHVVLMDVSARVSKAIAAIFADSEEARSRLVLRPRTPDYERIFAAADLFLDSIPQGGAYTMLDLMRLGVPYVVWINRSDDLRSFEDYQSDDYPYMFDSLDGYLSGAADLIRNPEKREAVIGANLVHYGKWYGAEPCRQFLEELIA